MVVWLAACGSTTAPTPPVTAPTTAVAKPIDESIRRAQLADAHHKLEAEQQGAFAATCTEPGKHARCLPSCYAGEPLDPRATKRPQQAIAIEHLACEKQGRAGSGPFTLADEVGKLAVRPTGAPGKPHKKGSWQAVVEEALVHLSRPKRSDAIVVTSAAWRNLEHPITKEKLRCVTVAHYARGIRSIDGCGEDGAIGCEAMGDPAAHGINVVHYRLVEAQRLEATGKSTECQQAALEAIAVARGLPRWRQYMQLNIAKWTPHTAYRTRFDGLLDEDALFTTAIALGKQAEALHAACGGASTQTTPAQEQSFHTCW